MTPETVEVLRERFGPSYRWLVTVTAMVGTMSMVISMTSVNVAVPDVMGAFGIGQDKAQWLSTAYLATMTAGMLVNAWLVSIFGERRIFLACLVVFMGGAALSGLAPNFDMLIFGRVLQGGSAGILQPLAMATIFTAFPPERRGTAMGYFGLGVVFAPAIGPTLGGVMIDLFSWRAIFYVPLPFCLAAFLLGSIFMPSRTLPSHLPRFDGLGFALLCTALFCLLSGIADGQREGWSSDRIVGVLSLGIAATAGFVLWEHMTKTPLLDMGLFRNPSFVAAAFVKLIFGAALTGSTYIVPVFVQTIQGYTPLRAGLMMMPAGILLAFIFPLAGRVSDVVPAHYPVIGGLIVFTFAFALTGFVDVNTPFWTFVVFIILGRLGLGFVNPVLNAHALKALPPDQVKQGAGASNFIRQLGGAFGVNGLVAFLETRTSFHNEALTATQTYANETSREMMTVLQGVYAQAGVSETIQQPGALYFLGQVVYAQGSSMGFQDAFFAVALIGALALVPAWIMSRAGHGQAVPRPIVPARPAAATLGRQQAAE